MEQDDLSFVLSPKRASIFEAILSTGVNGIAHSELRDRFKINGSPTTLRTTIHQINRVIKPMIIKARNGRYRVE